MRRRQFLATASALLLAPSTLAQQAGLEYPGGMSVRASETKIHRLGVLSGTSAGSPVVEAFLQGLGELGYVEGRNIVVDYRFADGHADRLPALAAELVQLKVDVIAAGPTPPVSGPCRDPPRPRRCA